MFGFRTEQYKALQTFLLMFGFRTEKDKATRTSVLSPNFTGSKIVLRRGKQVAKRVAFPTGFYKS